jgi:hypothetical protein
MHTLKGGLRIFGDNQPMQLAERLELAAADARSIGAGDLVEVKASFAGALRDMERHLAARAGANSAN